LVRNPPLSSPGRDCACAVYYHEISMPVLRNIGRFILANLAVAAIPTILLQIFRQGATVHDMGNNFQYSLIYTLCIATPAWFFMGRLGRRVSCLPRFSRVLSLAVALAGMALAGSFAANLIFVAIGWQETAHFWPDLGYGLRIAIFMTLLISVTTTVFEVLRGRLQAATEELRTRQLEEERARQLVTQARLSSLESRIHPHFLFNTLNSISALIREDPAQGRTDRGAAGGAVALFAGQQCPRPGALAAGVARGGGLPGDREDAFRRPPAVHAGCAAGRGGPGRSAAGAADWWWRTASSTPWRRAAMEARSAWPRACSSGCLVLEVSDDGPGFERSFPAAGPRPGEPSGALDRPCSTARAPRHRAPRRPHGGGSFRAAKESAGMMRAFRGGRRAAGGAPAQTHAG
jgi:hypothetical protein